MGFVWDIGFQTIEILIIIFGTSGILLSILLLLSPNLTIRVGQIFNRYFDTDKSLAWLDNSIQTELLAERYNIISGLLLASGSVIVLVFFFLDSDMLYCLKALFDPGKSTLLIEIIISTLVILEKIVGFAGLVIGLLLLFAPSKLRKIEKKMNLWFATRPLVDKLDASSHNIDSMVYKYPLIFGLIGFTASTLLTTLAVINILR